MSDDNARENSFGKAVRRDWWENQQTGEQRGEHVKRAFESMPMADQIAARRKYQNRPDLPGTSWESVT